MASDSSFELTDFQRQVMLVPEAHDLFLGGGRGGGKSTALAMLIMRHLAQHGADAHALYIRRTHRGTEDFASLALSLYPQAFPGARWNAADRIWRLPTGATLELGQLEAESDYAKYQGRSFTLLVIDEAGQYPDPKLIDLLRSNLRGSVPCRMVIAANPGGPGHAWLARRFVFNGTSPWLPHRAPDGTTAVYAPSTLKDNPHLGADYERQLAAACATDGELLKAWVNGSWAIARGAYFATVLDEQRVSVDEWSGLPEDARSRFARRHGAAGWEYSLAHDFGVAAPSVTYIVARSPGDEHEGRFYPRGSLILIDELVTCEPNDLNKGTGWTVPQIAEAIRAMCAGWAIPPQGVADDAIFARTGISSGTIADEFRRAGVAFDPARKGGRAHGWEIMRRLLLDAGKPDLPGLYVSRRCQYWWATVPNLARDPRRQDDVDTRQADHGADACRYACTYERPTVMVTQPMSAGRPLIPTMQLRGTYR